MIPGLSFDDTTKRLLFLLASSPSRSVPALLFVRPFSIISDFLRNYPELGDFRQLFRVASDKRKIYGKQETSQRSTSTYDLQYGLIELGPELEKLRRDMHLHITYQEKVTFLEISAQLRQDIWSVFAAEPEKYREARAILCGLIILSLPVPYTEPLWEMTSFVCKDVISTTLIPFLFTLVTSRLFDPDLLMERYSLLVFHLTNLGFVLDDTHWYLLFDNPKSSDFESFFNIQKHMSRLLNISSSELHAQKPQSPKEFRLPQGPLHVSLIGFTISLITWKSSIPDPWECYESWRSWWNANSPLRTTDFEETAYAIVYPEKINVTDLTSRLLPQSTCALAVGLLCSGHLETSSDLLDLNLTFDNGEMYSHVYGLLFSELVRLLILLDQPKKALVLAMAYLQETGTDHAYVSIAKADAYIALGKYNEAHKLLQHILSDSSTGSFERVCLILRLNKVERRTPDMLEHSKFTDNLVLALSLVGEQDSQIQEEYMNELQATVYHVKQPEKPVPSDLRRLIQDTLELYKEGDVTLEKQRSTLRMLIETNDTDIQTLGLEQVDRLSTVSLQRTSQQSVKATDKSTYANRDQNTDNQFNSNFESGTDHERVSSDPFPDSSTRVYSSFRPTARVTGIVTQEAEEAWRKRNLLSLDGNGTHLYWSLLVLQRLMDLIEQEEIEQILPRQHIPDLLGRQPGVYEKKSWRKALPCHYFDLICGASMGGFVAVALGKYRMGVDTCISVYMQILNHTFDKQSSNLAQTQSSSTQLARPPWDMTKAIRYFKSQYLRGTRMRTAPGTCAVFIAASIESELDTKEKRPYLIRSYDNLGFIPEDRRQDIIPINFGQASGLDTSEAMQGATASSDSPKETITYQSMPGPPEYVYLSDACNTSSRHLLSLAYQELEVLHGTEGIGTIVSVGVEQVQESRFSRSFSKGLAPLPKVSYGREPFTKLTRHVDYWRFSDREGIGVEQNEWKSRRIGTKRHEPGSASLAKIHAAFDKWASSPTNRAGLQNCALELVKRRRLRAANKERWNIFESGVALPYLFEDNDSAGKKKDAVLANRAAEERGPHRLVNNQAEIKLTKSSRAIYGSSQAKPEAFEILLS